MRLARALTAVVVVSVLACCSGDDTGDDDPSGDDPSGDGTPTPSVELDIALDARLGEGAPTGPEYPPGTSGLVADYTVTNNADVAVLVVERRPDDITPDVDVPLPDTAESSWVYADDTGAILVTKEIFATTGGDTGTAYRAPAVRLEPGQSVTGRAFALTPLRRIAPDGGTFEVPGPGTLPADATSWSFCVQIAPDPEETGGTGEPTMADHTPDRRLLCSTTTDLPPDAVGAGS